MEPEWFGVEDHLISTLHHTRGAAPRLVLRCWTCLSPGGGRAEMSQRQSTLKQIPRLKWVIFGLIPKTATWCETPLSVACSGSPWTTADKEAIYHPAEGCATLPVPPKAPCFAG